MEARTEPEYNLQRESAIIEGLKSVVEKRVSALNINDSTITSASYGDEEHIIVQIPLKANDALQNSANIQRAKDAIGKVVKIEFKELRENVTEADREERKKLAQEVFQKLSENSQDFLIESQRYQNNYEGINIGSTQEIDSFFASGTTLQLTEKNVSKEIISVKNSEQEAGYMVYQKDDNIYNYIIVAAEPSIWKPAQDSNGRVLDDTYFTKASVQLNEAFQPMIELTFNTQGAEIF